MTEATKARHGEPCPDCGVPMCTEDGLWYCDGCDAYHGEAEVDDGDVEPEGCNCCQVHSYATADDEQLGDECPRCGHPLKAHATL